MVPNAPNSHDADTEQGENSALKAGVKLDEKSLEMMDLINRYTSLDEETQKDVLDYLYGKGKLSLDFEKLVLQDKYQPVTVTMSEQTLEEGAQATIAVITHIGDRIGERLRRTVLSLSLGFGIVMAGGTTAILYFGGFMDGMDNNIEKIEPNINKMVLRMDSMEKNIGRMANYMESMSATINTTMPAMQKSIALGISDGVGVGQNVVIEMNKMNQRIRTINDNTKQLINEVRIMTGGINNNMNNINRNMYNMPNNMMNQVPGGQMYNKAKQMIPFLP